MRVFERTAVFVVAHPRAVLAAWAALLLAMAGASSGLTIDFAPSAFFSDHDPVAQRLADYRATFGRDDTRLFIVATCEDGTLLEEDRRRGLRELLRELRGSGGARRALGVPEAPVLVRSPDGAFAFRPAFDAIEEDPALPERWRTEPPPFVPALLSADQRAATFVVELDTDTDAMQVLYDKVKAVEKTLVELGPPRGVRLRMGGLPAARVSFIRITVGDQLRLFPLALLAMGLLLLALFRSVHGVIVPAVAAFSPVVVLLGAMALAGEPIGLVNQVFFTLIPALAVADAIHVVHRVHEELEGSSEPSRAEREAGIVRALSAIGPACFMTSLTTVLGFLSLTTSEIGVLVRFGLWAAAGLGVAFAGVLTLVPALLGLFRVRPLRRGSSGPLERALGHVVGPVLRHPRVTVGAFLGLTVAAAGLASGVVVDNELTTMLPQSSETSGSNQILDEKLGGVLPFAVLVEGDVETAAGLAALARLEAWLLAQPSVRTVQSPVVLYRSLHQAVTGEVGLPATDAAVAQYRELLDDKARAAVVQGGRARLLLGVRDQGGKALLALAEQLEDQARAELGPLGLEPQITGTAYAVFRRLGHLTGDLRLGLLVAFLTILGCLVVAFRSFRLIALATLPNALPLLLGVAVVAGAGWWLDLGPAVIFTVALGIAVDDTVHILARFQAEQSRGAGIDEALESAVRHAGRAVVVTSVVLACGFLIHTQSSFIGIIVIGWLGTTVVISALACDLLLLPALLRLGARKTP